MVRKKHIPQRMCVSCRQSEDKKGLTRLVRTDNGVVVDQTGKLAGRGAYLHNAPECWERGIKKFLAKALNSEISDQNREELIRYQENFNTEMTE